MSRRVALYPSRCHNLRQPPEVLFGSVRQARELKLPMTPQVTIASSSSANFGRAYVATGRRMAVYSTTSATTAVMAVMFTAGT